MNTYTIMESSPAGTRRAEVGTCGLTLLASRDQCAVLLNAMASVIRSWMEKNPNIVRVESHDGEVFVTTVDGELHYYVEEVRE